MAQTGFDIDGKIAARGGRLLFGQRGSPVGLGQPQVGVSNLRRRQRLVEREPLAGRRGPAMRHQPDHQDQRDPDAGKNHFAACCLYLANGMVFQTPSAT